MERSARVLRAAALAVGSEGGRPLPERGSELLGLLGPLEPLVFLSHSPSLARRMILALSLVARTSSKYGISAVMRHCDNLESD